MLKQNKRAECWEAKK